METIEKLKKCLSDPPEKFHFGDGTVLSKKKSWESRLKALKKQEWEDFLFIHVKVWKRNIFPQNGWKM